MANKSGKLNHSAINEEASEEDEDEEEERSTHRSSAKPSVREGDQGIIQKMQIGLQDKIKKYHNNNSEEKAPHTNILQVEEVDEDGGILGDATKGASPVKAMMN